MLSAEQCMPLVLFNQLRMLPSLRHRTLPTATNTASITSVFLCHAELLLYGLSVSVAQFALKYSKDRTDIQRCKQKSLVYALA